MALGLAVAGLVAYLVVPGVLDRRDRAARDHARRAAESLPDVAGAHPDPDCPSDVLRCRRVDRDMDAVLTEVQATFRAAGLRPEQDCGENVGLDHPELRSCSVHGETGGGHRVYVLVFKQGAGSLVWTSFD